MNFLVSMTHFLSVAWLPSFLCSVRSLDSPQRSPVNLELHWIRLTNGDAASFDLRSFNLSLDRVLGTRGDIAARRTGSFRDTKDPLVGVGTAPKRRCTVGALIRHIIATQPSHLAPIVGAVLSTIGDRIGNLQIVTSRNIALSGAGPFQPW